MLRMNAGEAGTGARGQATGAALGAFVGFVAGYVQLHEGARGDIEFEAAAAAVDQGARGDGESAFLLDHADRLARGTAGGPDVLDDEDAFTGLQLEAAAKGHLAGTVAFDEEGADSERARHFVADDHAAESRRDDARDGMISKNFRQCAAERFGVLGKLQHERTLDVRGAVASAGELEVALADGADLFENLENFVAFHGTAAALGGAKTGGNCAGSLMAQVGSVKQTRMPERHAAGHVRALVSVGCEDACDTNRALPSSKRSACTTEKGLLMAKLTRVDRSDILLVSNQTTKEH